MNPAPHAGYQHCRAGEFIKGKNIDQPTPIMAPLMCSPCIEEQTASLHRWIKHVGTNQGYVGLLQSVKWPHGFRCSSCGFCAGWYSEKRRLYECKSCGRQHSLLSDTALSKSHLPLEEWLAAAYLFSNFPWISARRLQSIIGVGSYVTALRVVSLFRSAITRWHSNLRLSGSVEMSAMELPPHAGNRSPSSAICDSIVVVIGAVELIQHPYDTVETPGNLLVQVECLPVGDIVGRFVAETLSAGACVYTDLDCKLFRRSGICVHGRAQANFCLISQLIAHFSQLHILRHTAVVRHNMESAALYTFEQYHKWTRWPPITTLLQLLCTHN